MSQRMTRSNVTGWIRQVLMRFDIPSTWGLGLGFLVYGISSNDPDYETLNPSQFTLPCQYQLSPYVIAVGTLLIFISILTFGQNFRNLNNIQRSLNNDIVKAAPRTWMDHSLVVILILTRLAEFALLLIISVRFSEPSISFPECQPANNYGIITFLLTIGFMHATISFLFNMCAGRFYGFNSLEPAMRKKVNERADLKERRNLLAKRFV